MYHSLVKIKVLLSFILAIMSCQKDGGASKGDQPKMQLPIGGTQESPKEEELQVYVDPSQIVGKISPSHLGFSQEWWRGPLEHNDLKSMFKRFKTFDTGPLLLRIGGSTADQMKYVPGKAVWEQFSRLHDELGFKFILNLNLGTATKELTKSQKEAAIKSMPDGSILQFEIGNEPNYFSNMGYKPANYLSQYPREFDDYGSFIDCKSAPMCAGPAWGHIYQDPKNLEWFIKTNKKHLDLVTAHFYKDNNETYNDPVSLLDESSMRRAMASLKAQVEVAAAYQLPLRVDESNPISGGGLDGVSNVFAAALWIIDTAFETALQGAVGLDLHQGSWRYSFYLEETSSDQLGQPLTTIRPQPAYYGILFFLEAVMGSASLPTNFIQAQATGGSLPGLKMWAIKQGTQLRIAFLNKNPDSDAPIVVEFPGDLYSDGSLVELVAPSLAHRKEISLAGQNFDTPGGFPGGPRITKTVSKNSAGGNSRFHIKVPKASGALLSIPMQSIVGGGKT